MTNSKYIVRKPIKDMRGRTIGHEIQYYGENQAYATVILPPRTPFTVCCFRIPTKYSRVR